jgi:hypothetical protein
MSRSNFRLVGTLIVALALASGDDETWAQNATSIVAASLEVDAPRWICRPDARGPWLNGGCKDPNALDCEARCVEIEHCKLGSVRSAISRCLNDSSCTPLVLYRRLNQRGCTFDPEAFWVARNAKPKPLAKPTNKLDLRKDLVVAPLQWQTPSCTTLEQDEIKGILDELPERHTPEGRQKAYAMLLKRGCNVDLDLMGKDGPYQNVALSREESGVADRSGLVPQPRLIVWFFGDDSTVPPPVPLTGEFSACKALERLHDIKRLALCAPQNSEDSVRIRFTERNDGTSPPTEFVTVFKPECASCPPTQTTLPPGQTTTLSFPVAIGSAGAGAALAAVSRWAFGRIKRRSSNQGNVPPFAQHDLDGVHVIAGFRERPIVRVHRVSENQRQPFDGSEN